MSEKKALHGLACPACGGMVTIPEGQVIVQCPYCDQCSLVQGERGVRRYQVVQRVDRDQAEQELRRFLSRHQAVARDAARRARLEEVFLTSLPFWASWVRALGWVFGQNRVRRNKTTYYEPREVKIAEDMTWTGAACDVGEFGVTQVLLKDQTLEPFDAEELHASGMVFEPVGSVSDARSAAADDFVERVRNVAGLDRVAQSFVRFVGQRFGLVYYGCCDPLDRKMAEVRMIPNVRKVSMSAWTDQELGASEIGVDYVFSRKPTPASLATDVFHAEAVREDLQTTKEICARHGCPLEFILKDISTVRYQPQRLWEWADIAMRLVGR